MPAEPRALFSLDPAVSFLNHGSFGACPRAVQEEQARLRASIEAEPVRFFVRELEPLLDLARAALAVFVGASPARLAFVRNATQGVNAVLRSLSFQAGDELLTTSHAYNACANALREAAARSGARVVVADVPFPLRSPDEVVDAVLSCTTSRTRLCLLDHVTSPTALVLPVDGIVEELERRGVMVLVDGAHAPGQVPLDVDRLGASFYVGNCHKWLFAPRGAGFLVAREDRLSLVRPTSISHGANSPRRDRSRFLLEFDWTGTDDPTPWLAVPAAIAFGEGLVHGGWPAAMRRNRDLARAARRLLCERLGVEPPAPDEMIASMASVPLPDGAGAPPASSLYLDPLQDVLLFRRGIEVPIVPWPAWPRRLLRVSAQIYNRLEEYEALADALLDALGAREGRAAR